MSPVPRPAKITLLLSEEEDHMLQRLASLAGLTVPDYLRRAIRRDDELQRSIEPDGPTKVRPRPPK